MPPADIARLQEARLMRMLAFAYEHAPLVRDAWQDAGVTPADIRSIADFTSKAPFLDKDDVRRFRDTKGDPCGGLMAVRQAELRLIGTTSGTTGDPTPVLLGHQPPFQISYMRDFWEIGCRPGDHIIRTLFTFRGPTRPEFHQAGWINIHFNHTPADVPRIFEASKRYRPTAAYPLSNPLIAAMEAELERTGEDPTEIFASYRGAAFGGEGLSPRQRAMTRSWGLDLRELGAVGDVMTGMECSAHDGMHVWEDMVFIECLEPFGDQPVADGEVGELVVTGLVDKFNPLIRFRTDDMVRIIRGTCACGRTHPRLQIKGRKSDRIEIEGRTVMPAEVQAIVEQHKPARAGLFQIVRRPGETDKLRLRVGFEAALLDTTSEAGLERQIVDSVVDALGVPVAVELVPTSELLKLGPPHKIPRVTKA